MHLDNNADPPVRSSRRTLVIVLLVAAAARVAACQWFTPDRFDVDRYQAIAQTLAEHQVYGVSPQRPTAFRPPLYPFVLAWIGPSGEHAKLRIQALQVLFGLLTVVLVFRLAERLGSSPFWAAWIVAVDPILLRQSTAAMTEPLAALLAVAALTAVCRLRHAPDYRTGIVSGLLLGCASLCRPTFIIWTGLLVCWFTWRSFRDRRNAAATLAVVVGASVMIVPWTVRNALVIGKPVFATTHGGYTLWLGNNPLFYDHLRRHGPAVPWDARELDAMFATISQRHDYDEVRVDRQCYEFALSAIAHDQPGFVMSTVVRVGRFVQPVPNRLDSNESVAKMAVRYTIGAWYILLAALLIDRLVRCRSCFVRRHIPLLLLIVAFAGLHAFYWSNMRMRAPVMPAFALLIATKTGGRRSRLTNRSTRGER